MKKSFQFYNNILGWLTFAVALLTYVLTLEPTNSFWDCGEFNAAAFKLQVGHPPGAPFWLITARIFSLFSFGDVTNVAMLINFMSALSSALTILFLFWTITHIARKLLISSTENVNDAMYSTGQTIAILGSGLVGALAYTFSDSFWFSAVEGEVYAMSSLFTALVFWAILKWENISDSPYANRWLVFIAYLMGLSIGVHLLNLLAIPAIVFVYSFKKYKTTNRSILFTSLVALAALAAVHYGIIPNVVLIASKFELFFVNSVGMGYFSGIFAYILVLFVALAGGIYFSHYTNKSIITTAFGSVAIILLGIPFALKNPIISFLLCLVAIYLTWLLSKKYTAVLNTILVIGTMIFIGYASYATIVIRSAANPPMDENNPENPFALLSYLNREQYGDSPLFYGQYYNAPVVDQKTGRAFYSPKDGKYVITDRRTEYVYDSRFMTLFPRMWSQGGGHENGYKSWGGVKGTPIAVEQRNGETQTVMRPTFFENLKYFFGYQLGHMYFRYFMWNFVGRQNNDQGHGGYTEGNWISGIKFIDAIRLGSQSKLPDAIEKNKAHNKYFFFPLILGIIGMIYMFQRNTKDFSVVLLLFVLTGIAIVVYTNQPPYQPRERDYAYAGSFYAFAIWLGIGLLAIYEWLTKFTKPAISAIVTTVLLLALVPGIMAEENWDDHNRSGRYTARDIARNYLESCAPNAIVFTYGDNDTFPLWYVQDVEEIRTDVRVVNLSLLATDWYIWQMQRKAYKSDPVPFSLPYEKYIQGKRDLVAIYDVPELFLNEKYEANKAGFEDWYKALYDNFMAVISTSKFVELHQNDYDKLAKGYTAIPVASFARLVNGIAKPESITKYELQEASTKLIKVQSDSLLQAIADSYLPIKVAMDFVANDDPSTKLGENQDLDFIPCRKLLIPVDGQKVLKNGTVPKEFANKVVPSIKFTLSGNYITKSELMILDLLASNNWERPIYFGSSIGDENYMNLQRYFQYEGLAYRVVPYITESNGGEPGSIPSEILYDNVMNKFTWGRMEEPDVYIDEQNIRTLKICKIHTVFARLAAKLVEEGDKEKAIAVLDKCLTIMPHEKVPFDHNMLTIVEAYYQAGADEKANRLVLQLSTIYTDLLDYYWSLKGIFAQSVDYEKQLAIQVMEQLIAMTENYKQQALSKQLEESFNKFVKLDDSQFNPMPQK